ncbi:ABC transporter permease [Rubellimicrobium sp. CFH 75288]|uniref:ABC transporter permease subunit n=1 Tax=Rubellimicrobium sp. CFH 75288 TaxID=2697034 RepID=UPI0014129B15|nr:ABC transporter permease subunit [Rubellimicrobium sp. CFH 75288]
MADATLTGPIPPAPGGAAARPPEAGPMLAADGTPLRLSLQRSLRRQKLRALLLIAPLLLFVLVTFVFPIGDMLMRSVDNRIVPETLPRTVEALAADPSPVPGEPVFEALLLDLAIAEERKVHTRLGTRLNYEWAGASSLFRAAGREVGRFDHYADQMRALDPRMGDGAAWAAWMGTPDAPGPLRGLARSPAAYDEWAALTAAAGRDPLDRAPADWVLTALALDLRGPLPPEAASALAPFDPAALERAPIRDIFLEQDRKWGEPGIWNAIRLYSGPFTPGYYLAALDRQLSPEGGIVLRPATERIHVFLFVRTLVMSLVITGFCILLGYPVAYLLASLPARTANLLMILVLLPFWTSLLVRTSAWKVLLQQQGVINDILVWAGIVADNARLVMINNQAGTIIAMTHILLPFMILPLYSVMKGIPPSYVRAARSLGANDWTAFWRVYFPQSVPGIGAGSILVFILAIGYYITPELVGGTSGVFISNRIAYHISTSLNWGLAAALGALLLVFVLILYWTYDRLVGIDNVKLGG